MGALSSDPKSAGIPTTGGAPHGGSPRRTGGLSMISPSSNSVTRSGPQVGDRTSQTASRPTPSPMGVDSRSRHSEIGNSRPNRSVEHKSELPSRFHHLSRLTIV